MTSKRNNKAAVTTETPMYYAMLAPELPVTVMDLEECFTAVPCFGIDDLVIDFPGGGLKISAYQHSVVETDEKRYLIGPSIVFRSGKDGTDMPITVEDIHILQALMVYKSTTLSQSRIKRYDAQKKHRSILQKRPVTTPGKAVTERS